jgi:hypothetical protein
MQVFMRSGETRQVDNIILCSAACTPRMMASIVSRLQTFTDHHLLHFERVCYHRVDELDLEEAWMKVGQHASRQQTGEIESVGSDLALRPFVTKSVTNSDGEPRGTGGNCHQFCDQIEGN